MSQYFYRDRDTEGDTLTFDTEWGSLFIKEGVYGSTFDLTKDVARELGQRLINYANGDNQ